MATDEELARQYEQEMLYAQQAQMQQGLNQYSPAMFTGQLKQNLVEWQLDFRAELEDIERLLRCDVLIRDNDGNEIWARNPEPKRIVFNDVGVNDIIREIRMFLNKNKVLSNYGVDEIKPRIRMIAHELRVLIYNNYEDYGIDNDYKMNNYSMVVITIVSMIEDAYRRAINGEERKDLNQARVVQQTDPMQHNYPMMPQQQQSNKKTWNPLTWLK